MTPEQQQKELDDLEKEAKTGDFIHKAEPIGQDDSKPRVEVGEMLAGVVMVAFNIISARRGEHWRLQEVEAQELGGALGDVVNEYFPEVSLGSLPVLGGVAAMIIVPRIMADQKIQEAASGGDQSEHTARE